MPTLLLHSQSRKLQIWQLLLPNNYLPLFCMCPKWVGDFLSTNFSYSARNTSLVYGLHSFWFCAPASTTGNSSFWDKYRTKTFYENIFFAPLIYICLFLSKLVLLSLTQLSQTSVSPTELPIYLIIVETMCQSLLVLKFVSLYRSN